MIMEPTWCNVSPGLYTRPLIGSEAIADRVSLLADGCMEVCHGLSFTTTLSNDCLVKRVRDALLRLRFQSPLIAAALHSDMASGARLWKYTAAKSYDDAVDWCQHALKVHLDAPSSEEFIVTTNSTSLPDVTDAYMLFFTCHLLVRNSGEHSLFFHGTHAIMDAIPTLDALGQMLGWMSVPRDAYLYPVPNLDWGQEWVHLPVGPLTATGGPQEGHEADVPRIVHHLEELEERTTPTASLRPQRNEICIQGKSLRIHRRLDRLQSTGLIRGVKELGFSVTVLFEAAQVLATLARSNISSEDRRNAHVTLDASIISLKRRFVAPYNTPAHFVSAMVMVPLVVPFADLTNLESKEQLLAIMAVLRRQYAEWTACPHLPWLGARPFRTAPHAGIITNIGVVENIVQRLWPDEDKPSFEIREMAFGHRNACNTRPITHIWTFNSEIHLQIQGSDIWDEDYLTEYMADIVDKALLVL